jgi:hypothetical protein
MFIVGRPCPDCGVRETVNLSDGRPLCLNCLLRRRPTRMRPRAEGRAGAGDAAQPDPAARWDVRPEIQRLQ